MKKTVILILMSIFMVIGTANAKNKDLTHSQKMEICKTMFAASYDVFQLFDNGLLPDQVIEKIKEDEEYQKELEIPNKRLYETVNLLYYFYIMRVAPEELNTDLYIGMCADSYK